MKNIKKTEEKDAKITESKDNGLKQKPLFKRILEWSLDHFFKTFSLLLLINILFFSFGNRIPVVLIIAAFVILTVYIILYLIKRIQKNINKLLHHELQFKEMIIGYLTSALFIVLLFSILYWGMTVVGAGYLKYGSCVDNTEITREMLLQDPLLVKDFMQYPYFSLITFFSVGFGDICPMGMSKIIAMLNAIIGNAFTVVILAIAITNYSTNKSGEKKRDKNKKMESRK